MDVYLRQKDPALIQHIQQVNPADIRLCSVVLAELLYGAYHSGPAHQTANLALIARLRQQFPSLPFNDAAAEICGGVREHLAKLLLVPPLLVPPLLVPPLLVPKLCLGTPGCEALLRVRARREAELPDVRSQAELGNEGDEGGPAD